MSNKSNKKVYTQEVHITKVQLEGYIDTINNGMDEEDDEYQPLTYKEVVNKKDLLHYICSSVIEDGVGVYDPEEFWNNDGWCDITDYR